MAKAKFDIRTEAARTFYAGAGVADIAVETVREYVADVQARVTGVQKDVTTRVNDIDYSPKALREQATTVVNARVEALAKDAKARRTAIEKRVAELQTEAKAYPAKVQKLVDENLAGVNDTYGDLVKRGETLVSRIRRQESTKATAASAKTTTTQAKKTASTAKSSAKATGTAAKKTASSAAQATTDAAAKVGD